MLLSRTTRTLFTGVGIGRARDRRCAAGAGAGDSGGDRAGLRPVRHASSRPGRAGTSPKAASSTSPADALTVTAKVRRTDREGTIPFGGSFGHSSLVEMPAPTEHTLTEVDAGAEFVRDPLLLRAGYTGSLFHNDVTSVDLRQSVPRDRQRVGVVAGPPDARAEQLVHRRQRPRVGEAAAPLARERVTCRSAGSPTPAIRSCRRRSIPRCTTGAARRAPTVDGEARTTAVNLTLRLPADALRRPHGRLPVSTTTTIGRPSSR